MKVEFDYKKVIASILAFLGVIGIGAEVATINQNNSVYADILLLPCIYFLYCMYMKCFLFKETRGFYRFVVGISVLFSTMLIAGGQLEKNSNLILTLSSLLKIFFVTIAIYPLISKITSWLNEIEVTEKVQNNKKVLPASFGVVVIVWGLTYLALFPGVYGTDAPYWYYEFSTSGVPISSQWSPFYCAIFYGLVKIGENAFGSYNAGFAIFSLVQMSFVLMVIWNILSFLEQRFKMKAVIMASIFFTMIPTHAILSLTSAQDPVFAACFSMCVIKLFKLAEDAQGYLAKRSNCISLSIWMILMCMIRNNGLYAILVMSLFVAISIRKYWKKIFMIIGVVVAVVLIYQGPIYNIIGIEKGTAIREMLSLPLQQMAYVYNYGYEELSEEQITAMLQYVSDEGWRSYEPCISDHVKAQLNTAVVSENMLDFVKLYIDVFSVAPGCYVKAAALQTFGVWYPNKIWPDDRTWHPYIAFLCSDTYGTELTSFTVRRSSLFPLYEGMLSTLYGKGTDYSGYGGELSMTFSKIPVWGTFSKVGIYFWMMLYLFFYSIYRKWREPFIIIGLGMGIYATVLLSPVILYRYCAPMIFSAPLFVAIFFIPWKKHDKYKTERVTP